ncbi:class I SAM-dependent methyltransferase [Nonomuraea sp. NPDC050310]|uniref:class I SAM-dependent methyltransferase n=1 Tax=unclassified Nonomuraea TaxID=2593643 RepID=UPI0033C02FB4
MAVARSTPPPDEVDPRIAQAQRAYHRFSLAIYDRLVLGLGCSLFWRCPASEMADLYDTSVGRRHLDIGPGTGYFVDRCRFPGPPELTLLDLSQPCLHASARRLARYRPDTCRADLTRPLPLPRHWFDSAAMNLVFHTIPGGWDGKGPILGHVAATLRPGGVLFGSTVLDAGVAMPRRTRWFLREQQRGHFHNQGDDPAGLDRQLARYFAEHRLWIRGNVALFRAVTAPG